MYRFFKVFLRSGFDIQLKSVIVDLGFKPFSLFLNETFIYINIPMVLNVILIATRSIRVHIRLRTLELAFARKENRRH